MLADQLDYIVGVDPHRDSHALAIVHVVSGTVVYESTVIANSDGYAQALRVADLHAPGRRAFAIEGSRESRFAFRSQAQGALTHPSVRWVRPPSARRLAGYDRRRSFDLSPCIAALVRT
jgi:hypothetical protein